jgi:hypothetical protein
MQARSSCGNLSLLAGVVLALGAAAPAMGGLDTVFVGGCPNDNWSCEANWAPPAVPNNDPPICYFVTLDDPDNPFLDLEVTINELTMIGTSQLTVSLSNLYIGGDMIMDGGSTYQGFGTNSIADLSVGGDLDLMEGILPADGPQMTLNGTMGLNILGDLMLSGGPGSCTPPDLSVAGSATVKVEGDFVIDTSANVTYNSTQQMCLAGRYDNMATSGSATTINLNNKKLRMAPTCAVVPPSPCPGPGPGPAASLGGPQEFEVAGDDLGPVPAGFTNNFAMGEIEIESGHTVVFEDTFDNQQNGLAACTEAVYVHLLVLESGSTIQLSDCRVYYDRLVNQGASIQGIGCGQLLPIPGGGGGGAPAVSGGWLVVLVAAAGLAIAYRFRATDVRGSAES